MTAQRSMTDEQLAVRWDKEPWVRFDADNQPWRYPNEVADSDFAPRPECIPSRDPRPWNTYQFTAWYRTPERTDTKSQFKPRPEFARPPVNPILSDVRDYRAERLRMNNPKGWDHVLRQVEHAANTNPWHATPDQIDFARKVLTRLASLQAVSL